MGKPDSILDEKKFTAKELIYVLTLGGAMIMHWYSLSSKLDEHIAREESSRMIVNIQIESMKAELERTRNFISALQFSPADKPKPFRYETESH